MTSISITGDEMRFEADIPDEAGFEIIDIVRRNGRVEAADGYRIEVESSNLSFNETIGPDTAQSAFEYVTETNQSEQQTESGLEKLVDGLTGRQLAFVSTLADDGGRVASTPLRERMDDEFGYSVSPRGLGGSIQGLHSKAKSRLGERLTDADWLQDEDEYEYWIKDEHLEQVREILDSA